MSLQLHFIRIALPSPVDTLRTWIQCVWRSLKSNVSWYCDVLCWLIMSRWFFFFVEYISQIFVTRSSICLSNYLSLLYLTSFSSSSFSANTGHYTIIKTCGWEGSSIDACSGYDSKNFPHCSSCNSKLCNGASKAIVSVLTLVLMVLISKIIN